MEHHVRIPFFQVAAREGADEANELVPANKLREFPRRLPEAELLRGP